MSSDLEAVLGKTWRTLCAPFDVVAETPAIECFFCSVDVSDPAEAARGVLVNGLMEMVEHIGRFSPWYTEPAATFGLELRRHGAGGARWILDRAAEERYAGLLDELAAAIRTEGALIEAMQHLTLVVGADESCAARCECEPPRLITVRRPRLIELSSLFCAACLRPFVPVT